MCGAEKIYIHKGEGKVEDLTPPYLQHSQYSGAFPQASDQRVSPVDTGESEAMYTKFMETFLPASVVLNEEDNVLHFFGSYSDYLTLAPGKATLNFFSMLNKDLSLVAATALSRCRTEHMPVTYTDIVVGLPQGPQGH